MPKLTKIAMTESGLQGTDVSVRCGDSAQMPTMWLTWGLNAGQYYNQYMHTYEIPMRNVRYNADNTEKE